MGRKLAGWVALTLALAMALPGAALAQLAPPPRAAPAPLPAAGIASTSSIPSPSFDSKLSGDTCPSVTDCWAVGFYGAAVTLGQVLHFDGTAWSSVPIPEPGGQASSAYDYLNAVTCTSSVSCWAVGYYRNQYRASVNEILHWNGATWTTVAAPQPGGTTSRMDQNHLYAVTCPLPTQCWAVGDRTSRTGAYLNEALRWNGKQWSVAAIQSPYGGARGDQNVAEGVSCASTADCTSVGYGRDHLGAYVNEALRWNGRAWTTVSVPQPGGTTDPVDYGYLGAVVCPAVGNCLAAGGYKSGRTGAYRNEVLDWNGTKWARTKTPDPGGSIAGSVNELTALSCITDGDCWAVGYYDNVRNTEVNEALHWDGTTWSSVATPRWSGKRLRDANLRGVACASSLACQAVGYVFNTRGPVLNEAVGWNGQIWSTE
jgi:hypothetical protein